MRAPFPTPFLVVAAALLGVVPLASRAQAPAGPMPAAPMPAAPAPAAAATQAVEVTQAWARPTAPRQRTGAAYLRLVSASGDRLLRASSPIAARVELHETRVDGGIMRMRELPGLDLPPGVVVALAPGTHHLMLVELRERLAPGQSFPLRLEFERGGPLEVAVTVGQPGAGHVGEHMGEHAH